MPVATQVGFMVGDDDQMPDPDFDPGLASGADIPLVGLIGLDRLHRLVSGGRVVGVRHGIHGGNVVGWGSRSVDRSVRRMLRRVAIPGAATFRL